ncbi:hypothetical protein C8A00DRAFT_17313, partial [Chaetomidium leptoderma]
SGAYYKNQVPSNIELLALRYYSPRGEGNGSINAMLAELHCMHRFDSKLPDGTTAPGSTAATVRLEKEMEKLKAKVTKLANANDALEERVDAFENSVREQRKTLSAGQHKAMSKVMEGVGKKRY